MAPKQNQQPPQTQPPQTNGGYTPPPMQQAAPPIRPPNNNRPQVPPPPATVGFNSLFTPAAQTSVKIKVLLWGAPGSHKTRSALSFPRPAVISVEGLAEVYARDYPNAFFTRATTIQAVENALATIIADGGRSCDTVVIDSITALYDERKAYYLGKRGYLGQVERERINIDMKRIYNLIAAAPVNVVIIAREAILYAEDTGSEKDRPKAIGVRIDADKSAAYVPNFNLHMIGGGAAILEKVQGMPITESKIPVANWDKFFSAIASQLADGANPDDIRVGMGKDLFLSHWQSMGLKNSQIATALGVKSSGEWTEGRAAADLRIEAYAKAQGWIKSDEPEPEADEDEPNEFMQRLGDALVPMSYRTFERMASTYESLCGDGTITPDLGLNEVAALMSDYALQNSE